jgi:hypothetical protein
MEIGALSLLSIVSGLRCMKVDLSQTRSGVIFFKTAFPALILLGLRSAFGGILLTGKSEDWQGLCFDQVDIMFGEAFER